MNLDEAAKRLGYVDAEHVEKNIENYGEPLTEWWSLLKELVNELPLNDVIKCRCIHDINERFPSELINKKCDDCNGVL